MIKEHTYSQIETIFKAGNSYARQRDIIAAGINPYQLRKLEAEGQIVKVARGLYRWTAHPSSDEMIEVGRLVPKGVFCLFSALAFYELTTYIPHEYHLAIERSEKVTLPDYPPIKLYFWSRKAQEMGIVSHTIGSAGTEQYPVRMYDMEKTICDLVKYRHKIGKDFVKEAFKNYLKRKDRILDRLLSYARIMRVEKIIQEYLTVLL